MVSRLFLFAPLAPQRTVQTSPQINRHQDVKFAKENKKPVYDWKSKLEGGIAVGFVGG